MCVCVCVMQEFCIEHILLISDKYENSPLNFYRLIIAFILYVKRTNLRVTAG